MKKLTIFLVFLTFTLSLATVASAEVVNHWPTSDQCLAAKDSPFYYPSIIGQQKLAKGEVVLGHPIGGCADMDLPDRLGDRGWVRIELGRKLVYGPDGTIRRLEECNNVIHSFVAFPATSSVPLTRDDLLNAIDTLGASIARREESWRTKPPRRPFCGESWRTGRRWGCFALGVLVIGGAAASQGGGGDHEQVTTLPPCTGLPCN